MATPPQKTHSTTTTTHTKTDTKPPSVKQAELQSQPPQPQTQTQQRGHSLTRSESDSTSAVSNPQYLLEGNRMWIEDEKKNHNSDYFKSLSVSQAPSYLWIGCSDSRVPAEKVTAANAGEIFVHRNIANLVVHTDVNSLSVIQYAVDVLKIPHIIICGHYGCGGVACALTNAQYGMVDNWLRNIKDVYRYHQKELDECSDSVARLNRLVELNVKEQVYNVAKTSIVENAWLRGQKVSVHGWVYSLEEGLLHDLKCTIACREDAPLIVKKDKEFHAH